MDVDPELVAYLITIILAILSSLLGKKWVTAKNKLSETSNLAIKLASALKTTSEAIEDNRVTNKEEQEIVKRWKEVIEQGKELLKPRF